jgi:hypothetical protein
MTINGTQHLVALTKCEVIAPFVNMVNQALPGDLYTYVGEALWKKFKEKIADLEPTDILWLENLVDKYLELKQQIGELKKKDKRAFDRIINEIKMLNTLNENRADLISTLFWLRINTKKEKRKIVKRGVMTISYGATP